MSVDQISAPSRTSTPAVRQFLARSPCPFADQARVFSCRSWPNADADAASMDALAADLRDFIERTECDLVILEISGSSLIESSAQAGALVNAILNGLRERDPASAEALTEGIEDPAWDFLFHGHSFFVSVFAPFYPESHPRCSGEPDRAFVLMQPERGFRRFGVSAQRPHRRALSSRVEKRFERRGHPYDAAVNQATPKALRYVKPVAAGDPPVAWWKLAY